MNERIKELMEQAGLYDFVIESMGINEEMEKFAELIVKECIKSAQPIGEYPIDGTWIEKSYWEGCSDAAEQIKEHFGVEE